MAFASTDALHQRINTLFDKVYEDPSDVSLNLELVRTQILIRDYKGASGTLERLLIISPDNRAAQVLMAQVKIAGQSFQEAVVLLTAVAAADDVDSQLRAQAEEMLLKVNALIDGFSWQASIEATVGITDNPENKPDKPSYSLIAPSSPIALTGQSEAFRGLRIAGTFEKRFNTYEATRLRTALSHQRRDYNTYNKSDYEVYNGSLTLINRDDNPIGGTISLMRVRVQDKDFMDQIELQTQKIFALPIGWTLNSTAFAGRQIHRTHPSFSSNTNKTGNLFKLAVSGSSMIGKNAVRTSLEYNRKEALKSANAYHQSKVRFDTNIPFSGFSILAQLGIADKKFDAADQIGSGTAVFSIDNAQATVYSGSSCPGCTASVDVQVTIDFAAMDYQLSSDVEFSKPGYNLVTFSDSSREIPLGQSDIGNQAFYTPSSSSAINALKEAYHFGNQQTFTSTSDPSSSFSDNVEVNYYYHGRLSNVSDMDNTNLGVAGYTKLLFQGTSLNTPSHVLTPE